MMKSVRQYAGFVMCTLVVSAMATGLGRVADQPWVPFLALSLNWTVGSLSALAMSEKLYDLTGTCTFLLCR
jgi:hypothetical protein